MKQTTHVPLWVSGFVTTMVTAPAACGLVVPEMLVALRLEIVTAAPPSVTVAPVWKALPAMVTAVPPTVDPLVGVIDVTVGAATYVKQAAHVPLCVSGFVTTTLTAPAACAVVVPLMLVGVIVETERGDPPNDTLEPLWKPVPATLTDVPPALAPLDGVTDVTVGAGAT